MEIRPKIVLSEKYLNLINKWYNTRIGSQLLNWPCFSHPDLASHFCNVFAKLPGDQDCEYCEHIPYRDCAAMCDIHHFCLASFAARLNLQKEEGLSIDKVIISILKKWRYPTLNKRVVDTLDLLAEAKQSIPILDEFKKEGKMPELSEKMPEYLKEGLSVEREDTPVEVPVIVMPPMPSDGVMSVDFPEEGVTKKKAQPVPEGYYTVHQLAERLNCSEALICKYMSTGAKTYSGKVVKLESKVDGRRKLVSEEEVLKFENAGVKRRLKT